MDTSESERELFDFCNRILMLSRTLEQKELDHLIKKLDSTISQFEESDKNNDRNSQDPQVQKLNEILYKVGKSDSLGVSQQVEDDIDAMQNIVDDMSDTN